MRSSTPPECAWPQPRSHPPASAPRSKRQESRRHETRRSGRGEGGYTRPTTPGGPRRARGRSTRRGLECALRASGLPEREVGPPAPTKLVLKLVSVARLDVELVVALQRLAVELDTETGTVRHAKTSALKRERLGDDVAALVEQVRVDRVAHHRLCRSEVHDGGGRDAKLAIAMQAEAEVERLADLRQLKKRRRAAPEVHVAQD